MYSGIPIFQTTRHVCGARDRMKAIQLDVFSYTKILLDFAKKPDLPEGGQSKLLPKIGFLSVSRPSLILQWHD